MSADARVRDLLRRIHETNGTPEEVCRDCPELLAEVREGWAKLRAFDARLEAFFPSATGDDETNPGSAAAAMPEFPGFEIAESLGSGGMGAVYKARELSTGRLVALKVVHPHLRTLPGFVERLTREAEIGRQVVHENVVRTVGLATDATHAASRRALVTEYFEGQTLRELLTEMGRVPEQLCRHVGREIAKGLAAIHAIGAVHRDVKPENVLITTENVVKVVDLGVARLFDADGKLTDAFVGSLRYAAPEQLRGGGAALDGRADLYALGLTLYELSTGRHPFQPDAAQPSGATISGATPRRAGELNPQLSPLFEELLARLLEDDRERRFERAADVADVLDRGEESAWWRERSIAIRRATRNAPRRIRIARETALHGRDEELSLLRVAFACATKGDGRAVLVQGEAGVGKSRLIDEFVGQLFQQGGEIYSLYGGYAPGGAATASGAFSAAYREFLGEEELETALGRRLPTALVSAFAALLRGEPPPSGSNAMTKDALQTAFTRTTQSLAEERPTVVVIEDLHLAPDEGRALFAALAHAVPGHRVLLVGTARRSLDSQWATALCRLPHVSRFIVRRLGLHHLTALLTESLRSAEVAEDLAPQIDRKSDGNPYFAFELLRGLRESGVLARSADGTWVAKQTIREISSPSTVTDLIAARIAELLPEEREMIEVAACCGFEFDPLLVGEVLGLARLPLLRRLGTLESARRLVRSSGRRYVFDHHQVQEVLYAGLSQTHRESYHAAIAESLERTSGATRPEPGDIDGDLCAALAGHFLDGGQGARALRYLDAALDHLERGFRNEAGVRLLDRALAAPGLLDDARRCAFVLRRAQRLDFMGRREAALDDFRAAVALADSADDPALRARSRALLAGREIQKGTNDEAIRLLGASIELWRQVGNREGEAEAIGLLGNACYFVARFDEARAHQRRRLAIAQEIGNSRNESAALGALGNMHLATSEHDDAMSCYERAAEAARRAGDRVLEGRCVGNFANVHWAVGRFEEARTHYEVSLARACEAGDRASEARVSGNLGTVLWALGRFADARTYCERSLRLQRETGFRLGEAQAGANLSVVLTWLGRPDDALRRLSEAGGIGAEIGSRHVQASVATFSGSALVELGRTADALAQFERAIEDARAVGDRLLAANALVCVAGPLTHDGRDADAVRALDEAAAVADEFGLRSMSVGAAAARTEFTGGSPDALAAVLERYGDRVDIVVRMRAHWVLWKAAHASDHLAEAADLLDFLVAHAPADCRASMIENVRLHRAISATKKTEGAS